MQKVFNNTTASTQIHEAVLLIENSKGDFSRNFTYGERTIDSPMVLASITKMFTTACILKLCEKGHLSLDDKISRYFNSDLLKGLHIYKGQEYSYNLTVSDLLFQISGLPDDFEGSGKNASTKMKAIFKGDTYITFEQDIAKTKTLSPHFAPNTKNQAYYSNINFDLLGEIIEKVTQISLAEAYQQFVFAPLKLDKTYLPVNENDFVPHVYYKMLKLARPKLISSCRASGGCVSSPKDLMTFSKGFWSGKLFDKKIFEHLSVYKKLQISKGPIHYGGGYMRISLGGFATLFMAKGELLGHSGSTGSFAFYYPLKDLYFVGDLSQLANPAVPIRLLMKLAIIA